VASPHPREKRRATTVCDTWRRGRRDARGGRSCCVHTCAMHFSPSPSTVRPHQAPYAPVPTLLSRSTAPEPSAAGAPAPSLRPPAPALKPVASERPPQQPAAQRSAAPRPSTPVSGSSAAGTDQREQKQFYSSTSDQREQKQFYSSTSAAAARAAVLASSYASASHVRPSSPSPLQVETPYVHADSRNRMPDAACAFAPPESTCFHRH